MTALGRVKRSWEWVAAVLGLVGLAPLMVLLAVLVKCTSRGPIFYISERLGCGGQGADAEE